MIGILYVVGVVAVVAGIFFGFIWGYLGLISGIGIFIAGLILLGLGKIIEVLQSIEAKLPNNITKRSGEFTVVSTDFEVYGGNEETYKFMEMNGEAFIQARVFRNYLEYDEDSCTFRLPNRSEVKLAKEGGYRTGAKLFSIDHVLFVSVEALGLTASHNGKEIVLSASTE